MSPDEPPKRTRLVMAICWVILGPLVSAALGYAAFFGFLFILGPGIDIDGRASGIQEFFGKLAMPALVIIPGIGVPTSFWRAWRWLQLP
jgi:hypothetical protein